MQTGDARKDIRLLILANERREGLLIQSALGQAGYDRVTISLSSREAIAGFIRGRPDVLMILETLADPDGLELIRRIRAGETIAPRDQVVVLVEPDHLPEHDHVGQGLLGINAYLKTPTSPNLADRVVMQALSQHYVALDAIELMDQGDKQTMDDSVEASYSSKEFSLEVGAMVAGLRLTDAIVIHGHELLPAGTVLREGHLRVIEGVEALLEGVEFRVRFPKN